jgi:hypothetical protein
MAYLPTEKAAAEFIASAPINGEFQALRYDEIGALVAHLRRDYPAS